MRKVTKEEMDVIGTRHSIHPRYRMEFLKLANEGRIDNDEFGRRLHTSRNYAKAGRDLMQLLSESVYEMLHTLRTAT